MTEKASRQASRDDRVQSAKSPGVVEEIENVVERLQQREREGGFRERPVLARSLFFRRGRVGAWREEVPADLVRKLIDVHGAMMRRFGYLNEQGDPI